MANSNKNPESVRFGGPGSSHQNRQAPEKSKPRGPHPIDKQSPDFSGVSGGGGEPDAHHNHNPRDKGN
jgi:hypothetical protein